MSLCILKLFSRESYKEHSQFYFHLLYKKIKMKWEENLTYDKESGLPKRCHFSSHV